VRTHINPPLIYQIMNYVPVIMTRQQLRSLYSEAQRAQRAREIAATVDWIGGVMIAAATEGQIRCQISILATPVLARDRHMVIDALQSRFPDVTFWISSSATYLLIDWA
jgi:hypothetical protein